MTQYAKQQFQKSTGILQLIQFYKKYCAKQNKKPINRKDTLQK